MGKRFIPFSNLLQFGLSTYEMKTYSGALTKGVPNFARRFFGAGIYIIPLFTATYLTREYLLEDRKRRTRKEGKALEAAASKA